MKFIYKSKLLPQILSLVLTVLILFFTICTANAGETKSTELESKLGNRVAFF